MLCTPIGPNVLEGKVQVFVHAAVLGTGEGVSFFIGSASMDGGFFMSGGRGQGPRQLYRWRWQCLAARPLYRAFGFLVRGVGGRKIAAPL